MTRFSRSSITAVLGPTNTGKTHIAVERMLGHSSGMMGFPLRLLAREVYDRVVAIKGEGAAALVTGEERIWPESAKYLLCTAEAMPLTPAGPAATGAMPPFAPRDVAFVALDEAQLGQDRERGHIFTSRLLHARGREETMILGSGALAPVVRSLVPNADIIARPRFSTLSYDGPRKLSRLPPRSAIVAFSAEQVYAIAEALRRFSGGAAVVMGALSPRTRNAQVAMFQAGEVDYLVATDAIGMGLNLDVAHVAFASLEKFDGQRLRRLTVPEMAQIAGRAGRHQRDGTFGSVGAEAAFTPEEIAAIEEHHFPPLDWMYWREPNPSLDSVSALIGALQTPPDKPCLRPAPESTDLAILRSLEGDADAMALIDGPNSVGRLWGACSLPDFRKSGIEAHARFVARIWRDLGSGNGEIDGDWFSAQLRGLDNADGSVEQLADRIAGVRSYCYIAQRRDWIANAAGRAEEAQAIEARLSDALHNALTARFVDRRTSVLLRALGQDASSLPVRVSDEGAVLVDGEAIGTLDGFAFRVDPAARASDQRMLLAAAEKYLAVELARRASALATARNRDLALALSAGDLPGIEWHGRRVATLVRGKNRLAPRIELDKAIAALDQHVIAAVSARLAAFVDGRVNQILRPLVSLAARARDAETPPPLRALFAVLVDGNGAAARAEVETSLAALDDAGRGELRQSGIRIGTLDLFHPMMVKTNALHWLTALDCAWRSCAVALLPRDGVGLLPAGETPMAALPGFRLVGSWWVRVDLVERVALHAHAARKGPAPAKAAPVVAVERKTKAPLAPAAAVAAPIAAAPDDAPILDAAATPEAEAIDTQAENADIAAAVPASADDAQAAAPQRPAGFTISPELARSVGLPLADRMLLLRMLGFRLGDNDAEVTAENEAQVRWVWRGRKPVQRQRPQHGRRPAKTGAEGEGDNRAHGRPDRRNQRHDNAANPRRRPDQAGAGNAAPDRNQHKRPRPDGGDRSGSDRPGGNKPPRRDQPRNFGGAGQRPARREPINNPFGVLAGLLDKKPGDGKKGGGSDEPA